MKEETERKEDGRQLVLPDVPTKRTERKKKERKKKYLMQSSPKKREKNQRDVRMNDATEKCEDDQRGKENSPPRKKLIFYGRDLKKEGEGCRVSEK